MLIERLKKQTGLSDSQLLRFAMTASKRYKVYTIPKRNGGFRTIEHPSKELKSLQRWINSRLVRTLPIHPAATAYEKGANIRANALAHVGSKFTLRLDFSDFFPSFTFEHIKAFLRKQREDGNIDVTDKDISFVCLIVSRNGRLTIGAPSSPNLTNAMMYDFDSKLSRYTTSLGLIYTRYADDIFISSYQPHQLDNIAARIRDLAKSFEFANLSINDEKTAFLSRKFNRRVTGLVLTPDNRISIGRSRKREMKALVHKFSIGNLEPEMLGYLKGLLAFVRGCEPEFLEALAKKYGTEAIRMISSS